LKFELQDSEVSF